MRKLERVTSSDRISAEAINQLIDALEEMRNRAPGPGLGKTSDGVLYTLGSTRAVSQGSASEDDSGGTLLELDFTQGTQDTDTWDVVDDACPVSVQVLTDLEYNTTSHKLQARTRLLTFTRKGRLTAIGAESSLVDIATAVDCTS